VAIIAVVSDGGQHGQESEEGKEGCEEENRQEEEVTPADLFSASRHRRNSQAPRKRAGRYCRR
jgi:hypothetical protein